MTLVRFDPLRDMAQLRRRFDRVFTDMLSRYSDESVDDNLAASWVPPVDIFESQDVIELRAELPGLSEDDVELSIEDGRLIVRGEKRFEKDESEGQYRRVESRYGAFYRSFPLPNSVSWDAIDATFRNGVLTITLPKAEEARPRKIEVKVN